MFIPASLRSSQINSQLNIMQVKYYASIVPIAVTPFSPMRCYSFIYLKICLIWLIGAGACIPCLVAGHGFDTMAGADLVSFSAPLPGWPPTGSPVMASDLDAPRIAAGFDFNVGGPCGMQMPRR